MHQHSSTRTRLQEFLATHPIFTKEDFVKALSGGSPRTRDIQLGYYEKKGRLLRIRRGVYAAVPLGTPKDTFQPDPFLVAAKLAPGAILAYHTALRFHGKAQSHRSVLTFLTRHGTRPLSFKGVHFQGVRFPKALRTEKERLFGVQTADRQGLAVRVTSLERTLVDVLDRPALGGGWEEVWRSLESVEYFDLGVVTQYALLLGNATTIAAVGFFLEQHQKELMVEPSHLERLRKHRPRGRHYLDDRARKGGRLQSGWNLIVPREIVERSWQEVP